jgi:hypothetical protein
MLPRDASQSFRIVCPRLFASEERPHSDCGFSDGAFLAPTQRARAQAGCALSIRFSMTVIGAAKLGILNERLPLNLAVVQSARYRHQRKRARNVSTSLSSCPLASKFRGRKRGQSLSCRQRIKLATNPTLRAHHLTATTPQSLTASDRSPDLSGFAPPARTQQATKPLLATQSPPQASQAE